MTDFVKHRLFSENDNSASSGSTGTLTPTSITYAALLSLYNAGTMTPGFYKITDRADMGIVVEAVSEDKLALEGTGLFLVADYQGVGTYPSGLYTQLGIWHAGLTPSLAVEVCIWNGLHYVYAGPGNDEPGTSGCWTVYAKATQAAGSDLGYILDADAIEYRIDTDAILSRKDKRGNFVENINPSIDYFQWGSDQNTSNYVSQQATLGNLNSRGGFGYNILTSVAYVSADNTHLGSVQGNYFSGMQTDSAQGTFTVNMNAGKVLAGCIVESNTNITFDPATNYRGLFIPERYSKINKTYAQLVALYNAGTMLTGLYNITDRGDAGLIVEAVSGSKLNPVGTGYFLNPDFQNVGGYGGVVGLTGIAYTSTRGLWEAATEITTITYSNLTGGTFTVGTTVYGGAGETGLVVSDNGVNSMTIYRTSDNVFTAASVIGDGISIDADVDSVANSNAYFDGMVVFWNGLHYQVVDSDLFDGTDPATNVTAFTLLDKATANVGYETELNYIEYDLLSDTIIRRKDKRGNSVAFASLSTFQFGNDAVANNTIDGTMDNLNGFFVSCKNNYIGNYITYTTIPVSGASQTHDNNRIYNVFADTNSNISVTMNPNEGGCYGNIINAIGTIDFSNTSWDPTNGILFPGFASNFLEYYSIDGLTTMDLGANQAHVGEVVLSSANATESIDLFAGFKPGVPVRFMPESGLTVTFVHGTGANQPRCNGAANKVINGTNGDSIQFVKRQDGFIYQSNGNTF